MNELISIIVPIYQAEAYLDRCIQSVLRQTYTNFQLVLINDGSTDTCDQICRKWASLDDRIRYICKENGGVSSSRNAGISNAAGAYILMVDSDDYISPIMLEKMYHVLIESDSDLVLCNYEKGTDPFYSFKSDKETSTKWELIDNVTALNRIYDDSDSALRYIAPWGKLYRKKLFENIKYPEGKIFEDIYVTHQLLYRCRRIAVLSDKLTYYFQHEDSIMNKEFHAGKLDYLGALDQRIRFYAENGLKELSDIAYDEYLHSLIWEYSRARDLLKDNNIRLEISKRFREVYHPGHSSNRYPKESALFLIAFYMNPELIINYWIVRGKLNRLKR